VEKNAIKRDGAYARSIRKLEERTLPQVDGLVFVSNFMRREVCKRMPMLTAVRSAVIPNWCEERARESPDTIHFDLINIGTLEPRKNQQFLLHVLAHAVALKRRYTLALVGDGPDRTMLTQLASELGIADQVKFLGYRKNAAQLIPRAHLYVHSATVENLPIALIEAFACAKSVLAPNVGGIADILTDGKEGIFWRTDDVPGAAAQLVRLLEDDEHRLALGARARERYETELNAPLIAERLYTFLCKTDGVQTKSNANSYAVNTDAAF
jgi:glycosyltransferase involved in cell wall biosynthesis